MGHQSKSNGCGTTVGLLSDCCHHAESMRREKYEFSVSPPVVVYREADGRRQEPMEEVHCEIEEEHSGAVIEALSLRRGELLEMLPLQVRAYPDLYLSGFGASLNRMDPPISPHSNIVH